MKGAVKAVLGRVAFGSPLPGMMLKRAAVVVLFHRVQDTARDELTISAAMFERYCRFFQRHFRVVSLTSLLTTLGAGADFDRELVITFDDGYRDNFECAAPVLTRLGLPATFFVATRWIGTDVVPWWDEARNARHPWMTWDQVRSLHRQGFEVGAHTRTHVDLGRVSGAEAWDEILGARLDLEARLAAPIELFAYPFGGRSHMTEANRELVRAAGLRCCCASYGGVNGSGVNPLRLRRVAISPWLGSPHQFGFEVIRGATVIDAPGSPLPGPVSPAAAGAGR